MSTIKVCDKCGIKITSKKDFSANIWILDPQHGKTTPDYELCEDCKVKLLKWLQEHK
jgi:hypothetical protein